MNLLVPLLRDIGMCAHQLFCTKFNAQQLLFELFSDIIWILSSVQPENVSSFPILVQYNV